MSTLLRNLLIILGIGIVLFGGYLLLRNNDSVSDLIQTSSGVSDSSANARAEIDNLLVQAHLLDSFDISGDLFQDQRFVSLFDYRTDLGSESIGRPNPFAPLR